MQVLILVGFAVRHPYVLLCLTTLFWGANAIAGRLAIGHVDPHWLTMWRWLGVILALSVFVPHKIAKDWPVVRREWWKIASLGILGYSGFNLFLYGGLAHTTALNAAILQASIPILVVVISALVLSERIVFAQFVALVFVVIGVLITLSRGHVDTILELSINHGDLFILISSLLYALYSIGLRWRPQVTLQGFLFFAGCFAFVSSAALVGVDIVRSGVQIPTLQGWTIVAFTIIFPSLLSQVFYIVGVEAIGAARASLFINLIPVFSALLAIIVLGERFKMYHALGFVAVAAGIVLNEWAARRCKQ